jgi:uncharacterized membrane protein YhaH (DUF805 family)
MIAFHRGAGMLVPFFGIFSALLMNIVTIKLFGDSYYQERKWPKLLVLLIAGLSCFVVGALLKKKRLRDAQKEQEHIDSLSPKVNTIRQIAFAGPRDQLMFIPLQYWSIVYFMAALIYAIQNHMIR